MYDRILIPVDGTLESEHAIEEGARLAAACGGAVDLLYAVDAEGVIEEPDHVLLESRLGMEGRAALRRASNLALAEGVEDVRDHLVAGSPHDAIVEFVESHGVDAVVMGTHDRRGIDRLLFESQTSKVLRTSPVPVLVVRLPAGEGSDT